MTFQEFLELNYDKKYVTLDNFYRDHLYLRTLAKRFYGDNEYKLGTCIFTKDGDFLRSRPTDDSAFKSNCSTVLFDKGQSAIFFDSEEAVFIYRRMTETLESPHYHLSKDEIIEMIEEDLDSQIDGVKKVIDDYNTQIRLHQNRVDYLDQMKIDLRKAAKIEDQVSRIEDLLDAANEKLVDTKFKFVVNEVIDKSIILDHDGEDVYNIHFVYDNHSLEELKTWVQTQIDNTRFYDLLIEEFSQSKLIPAAVDCPVGIAFDDRNRAELFYDAETNRVTIFYYQDLTITDVHKLLNSLHSSKSTSVECAISYYFTDEESPFYLKTVSVCDLLDLAEAVKKIKESLK